MTGLAILLPELDGKLAEIRAKHDPAFAQGLGAHVTVLFPFAPEARLNNAVHTDLARLFGGHPAFDVEFTQIGRFPGALYLNPTPAQEFHDLTRSVWNAHPEFPPYGGAFREIVPHLTLAQGTDLAAAEFTANALPLPLAARARAVAHLALRDGRWHQIARYRLAAAAGV